MKKSLAIGFFLAFAITVSSNATGRATWGLTLNELLKDGLPKPFGNIRKAPKENEAGPYSDRYGTVLALGEFFGPDFQGNVKFYFVGERTSAIVINVPSVSQARIMAERLRDEYGFPGYDYREPAKNCIHQVTEWHPEKSNSGIEIVAFDSYDCGYSKPGEFNLIFRPTLTHDDTGL